MKDTVVGIFEGHDQAVAAMSRMADDRWEPATLSVRRVLRTEHRGLGDDDDSAVYNLVHAPDVADDSTLTDDAAVNIIVVDIAADADPEAAISALEALGAEETRFIAGTPPLDL